MSLSRIANVIEMKFLKLNFQTVVDSNKEMFYQSKDFQIFFCYMELSMLFITSKSTIFHVFLTFN